MAERSQNPARVRSILRDAIRNGFYPPGSTLPSTRELAAQFRINRNTASKIYHELAREHVIELGANKPPMVVDAAPGHPARAFSRRLRETLEPLLTESQLNGISPEEVRRVLLETADELMASTSTPSIYLVECNREEARHYAQELTLKLGSIVEPVLMSQLAPDIPADVIIAPYFHLNEAREILGHGDSRLVGLVVTADSSDIARVASMVSTGPLGVVAIHLRAAERLRRLLGFQIDVPMIIGATDQPVTLDAIRDEAELIACTVRAHKETRELVSEIPLVLVQYHPDEHSIESLRRQIPNLDGAAGPSIRSASNDRDTRR